jgi:competence protein ComEA
MDVLPAPVDVDELRAELREEVQAQVRKQYRGYALVFAALVLVVAVVIVRSVMREQRPVQTGAVLTPPPYWGQMCAPAAVADEIAPRVTASPQPLRVYVSGAVAQPGVVTLPADSLLAAALAAAGGAADDADLEGVNLAASLADNQHIIVPRYTPTPLPAKPVVATALPNAILVNINTATAAELEMLPHIGPTMAQRIIAYREAHGPFARIEDLQEVEGIGPRRYADLAPLIAVEP